MYYNKNSNVIEINENDKKILNTIITTLTNKIIIVKDEKDTNFYTNLNNEDLWMKIVEQFCVMGGAKLLDNIKNKDEKKWSSFKKKISDKICWRFGLGKSYLAEVNR